MSTGRGDYRPGTPEPRKLLREHYVECDRISNEWAGSGRRSGMPSLPPFPDVCRGMNCGAKTRKGTPFKRTDLYSNSRCKLHGGLSTGPKTAAGKKRSAANGLKPKKKRTP